jgi:putative salt-induced outer membrane protein YdiY
MNTAVFSDELHLKNGDRITGKVITMKDGIITFETSYAGELKIDWDQVTELKTEKSIAVLLNNDTRLKGVAEPGEDGTVKLKMDLISEHLAFNLKDVKAINLKEEPAVKWTARANVGVKIEGGNTDSEDYHLDGQLQSQTGVHRFTAGLELDREFTNDDRTENSWLAYTKYDHFLSEKWYINTNASYEKDDFKDINARTVLGVGPGYQFWKSDLRNLSTELGYAYINESYAGPTDNKDYSAFRWATNYDHFLYKKIVQFFHWNETFMSADDNEDIWLRSRTGFRFPLYRGITWTVQYTWDWDNEPAEGQKRDDTTLNITLGYQYQVGQ